MTSKFSSRVSISSVPTDIPLRSHYVPSFPRPSTYPSKPPRRHFPKLIHYTLLFLSLLSLIASLVILGCVVTSLRTYSRTHLTSQWRLPLWPTDVDFRPTHALLAFSIISTLISLLSILVSLSSVSHPSLHTTTANVTSSLNTSSSPSFSRSSPY